MDLEKIGKLIYFLRKEKGLTQQQLADMLNISNKTVSKWERGGGLPEMSLLKELAEILDINVTTLLRGELEQNEPLGGNMKKLNFYICPVCGNLITSTGKAAVSCCGKILDAVTPQKATDDEKLSVELIENEYFVSSDHEMTKEHYIIFVALLTGDCMILRKQYPEWDLQTRIPRLAHGKLIWCCNKHGVFYQLV